jgi:hypothetical protein
MLIFIYFLLLNLIYIFFIVIFSNNYFSILPFNTGWLEITLGIFIFLLLMGHSSLIIQV